MTVSIVFSIIFIIFECINGFGAINNKKNYDYDNSHIEYVETKLGIDLPNDAKVIWNGKYAGEVTVKDNLTLDEGIIIFKNELDLSLIDSNKFKKDLTEEDKAFIPCDYKEGFVDYEYFSILCFDDGTYFNYKNTKDKKYLACGYDIDSKIFYIQIFKKS